MRDEIKCYTERKREINGSKPRIRRKGKAAGIHSLSMAILEPKADCDHCASLAKQGLKCAYYVCFGMEFVSTDE